MIESKKLLLLALAALFIPAAFALDAPVVTSSTHSDDSWAGMPMSFEWEAIEGATKYCYAVTQEEDADAPDEPCTDLTNVQPPQKISSGEYYFHVKAVSGIDESSTTTFAFKLDIEVPSRPFLSFESKSDGSIELSWTESEDDASGIKEYEIYRKLMANFDIRETPIHTTVSGSTLGFVDANEMAQSTTYHYKVRAIDNAGNPGPVSNEIHAQTVAKCDLEIDFTAELSSDQESLELAISSNDKIYRGSLTAALPGSTDHSFFEEAEAFLEWDGTLDLSEIEEGYIDLSLHAEEIFGDDCSLEKRFVYDVTPPEISFVFPKYNDRLSETVPIEVEVEDKGIFKSGIESVEFFLLENENWERFGAGEEDKNGFYRFDWDTFSVENGPQRIKAVVTDNGGNSVEAAQNIKVLNAFESSLDLNAALQRCEEARKKALVAKWGLQAQAIYSDEVNRLIEEADLDLAEAKTLSEQPGLENETNAKIMLADAILAYQQSETVVSTTVYKTADFIFNREQVDILLNAAGITGATAEQAKQYIEKADPKRQLKILNVRDLNADYYRALIVVSFSLDANILNDSNAGDLVMQVIEVIPKEFAEYASELDSNSSFDVLEEDPKLSFSLTREQYKKKELVYALKGDLSQQQADSLIAENVVNKFIAPPVFLPMGVAPIPLSVSLELLLFVGISVAVVLAVLIVVVLLKKGLLSLPKGPKPGRAKKSKEPKPKKRKPPLGGIKLPSIKKKSESPLSVFGKK